MSSTSLYDNYVLYQNFQSLLMSDGELEGSGDDFEG